MIEEIVRQNNEECYSNEVFKKAEYFIQQETTLLENEMKKEADMVTEAAKHKYSENPVTRGTRHLKEIIKYRKTTNK